MFGDGRGCTLGTSQSPNILKILLILVVRNRWVAGIRNIL